MVCCRLHTHTRTRTRKRTHTRARTHARTRTRTRTHTQTGKAGFVLSLCSLIFYYRAVLLCAQIIGCIMALFVCLYITLLHYLIVIMGSIWRYWNSNKILVRYFLSSVCLRLSQFFQSSFMQYMELCVFSLPISLMMIVRIGVLYHNIIIKSEVWSIYHCLGLYHKTMVYVVCLSVFLWSY